MVCLLTFLVWYRSLFLTETLFFQSHSYHICSKLKKELLLNIRLPKRGKMVKGISNLLVRLASLLRQSVSHNALKAVNGNATNVVDIDAGDIGCCIRQMLMGAAIVVQGAIVVWIRGTQRSCTSGYINHISVGEG